MESSMTRPLRDDLMVQQQLPAPRFIPEFGGQGRRINRMAAWQHMVAVIMLNQTGRVPVKTVFPIFMDRWPYPIMFAHRSTESEVKDVIWPLGLVNVRYQRLLRMTDDFLKWDENGSADELYGIGKYGSDSYEIFFKQNYTVRPTDKELLRYLREEVEVPA